MERFPEMPTLAIEEIEAGGETRTFIGDGGPILEVPGLVEVKAVRVGRTLLPLIEKRSYPVNKQNKQQEVEEPMIDLSRRADGMEVLRRSILSNQGNWQKGVAIYVNGIWKEDGTEQATPAPANQIQPKGFDALEPRVAEILRAQLTGTDEDRITFIRTSSADDLAKIEGITKADAKKIAAAFTEEK